MDSLELLSLDLIHIFRQALRSQPLNPESCKAKTQATKMLLRLNPQEASDVTRPRTLPLGSSLKSKSTRIPDRGARTGPPFREEKPAAFGSPLPRLAAELSAAVVHQDEYFLKTFLGSWAQFCKGSYQLPSGPTLTPELSHIPKSTST